MENELEVKVNEVPAEASVEEHEVPVTEAPAIDTEAEIARLEARLAELKSPKTLYEQFLEALGVTEEPKAGNGGGAKNHKPRKVDPNRKYVLLLDKLPTFGRVPQQQADIADIITRSFEVNVPFSEADLFEAVTSLAPQYPQLAKSVQHPTYLFTYYRGLDGKDNKHFGYIRRKFLRQIDPK